MNTDSFFLYFLLSSFILFLVRYIFRPSPLQKSPNPPGPRPWPIVGNIFHVGSKPHLSLTKLAQVHGPLMSLKLGSKLLVVGSSPDVAAEILKTHDRILSGRYVPDMIPYQGTPLNGLSLVWAAECSQKWKSLRILCRSQLSTAKAKQSQANMRERITLQMVEFLKSKEGEVVRIQYAVFTTVVNTLSNLFFSKDLLAFEDEGASSKLRSVVLEATELATAPNISDFYPIFSGLDIQGLRRRCFVLFREIFDIWDAHIKERRLSFDNGVKDEKDLLDVLLANNFSDEQINVVFLELFIAGTDTTTATAEWALTELIMNPEGMNKLRQELRNIIKDQNTLTETQISQLPYLQACVKETLRLHPPAPFLLPHQAAETCEIMNYTIPKNSLIIVNLFAIGLDPTIWEDPLTFKPERFLNSDKDFKGQDFDFIPFGTGRRICPGLPFAVKLITLVIASLVASFDWCLPIGEIPPQIDMDDKFEVKLQQPLLVVPKRMML